MRNSKGVCMPKLHVCIISSSSDARSRNSRTFHIRYVSQLPMQNLMLCHWWNSSLASSTAYVQRIWRARKKKKKCELGITWNMLLACFHHRVSAYILHIAQWSRRNFAESTLPTVANEMRCILAMITLLLSHIVKWTRWWLADMPGQNQVRNKFHVIAALLVK